MAEIGGAVKEGLLALAVAAGLQVMTTMMEESVIVLAGPKGRHQPDVRHGTEPGSVAVGGRWVTVRRPRVRAVDGPVSCLSICVALAAIAAAIGNAVASGAVPAAVNAVAVIVLLVVLLVLVWRVWGRP